jgi:hypothetical protein
MNKILSNLGGKIALALLFAGALYATFLWQPAPAPAPAEQAAPGTFAETPEQIKEFGGIREDGEIKFGYTPRPAESKQFVASLAKPLLAQAGPDVLAKAQNQKPVLLYRALYEAFAHFNGGEQWRVGKQGIGDCVSWGWAHGADTHLAVMWKNGDTGEWRQAATESIYGGSRVEARGVNRGGYSDGSYGAAAAKWVSKWGVTFRQPYDRFDLTKYSASRAKEWGNFGNGGEGDGGAFDETAKKHPIKGVVLIRNFKEAAAAIQSGYPIPVCSGQGFSSSRDKDGFCNPRGSWAHCMCFIGVRFDRPGLLCLNSWGTSWVSGPKFPDDQPDGSFWVDEATVNSMLRGEDSFAVSGYEGFPYRDLTHGDWVLTDPADVEVYLARLERPSRRREALASYSISP